MDDDGGDVDDEVMCPLVSVVSKDVQYYCCLSFNGKFPENLFLFLQSKWHQQPSSERI